MPAKPAPPLAVSHRFGPFDGQVCGHIPQGPDRNAEGHFIPGPVRAYPITARLTGSTIDGGREDDGVLTPAPHVARVQQRARRQEQARRLDRHFAACARLAAAVRGEPVGRNRAQRAA